MYNFEFKLRSHYTQKGILPKKSNDKTGLITMANTVKKKLHR